MSQRAVRGTGKAKMPKVVLFATHAYATNLYLDERVCFEGDGRCKTNAYISDGTVGKDGKPLDVGMDIFQRGLCLPSDNKMTVEQQDFVIQAIRACFE